MGYLATEIIVLLGGAAVLGIIIGWAVFGLGKKPAVAGAAIGSTASASPKTEAELKAERDARKKAEGRILELESKETNFNDRLQERDAKVAELSHQLDDISQYRVHSAAELDARDQRIAGLEAQVKQRDADLQRATSAVTSSIATASTVVAGAGSDLEKLAEKDRTITRLKGELEAAAKAASAAAAAATSATTSASGGTAADAARMRELERENAELRQTLIATDGAAPTTSTEKDAVIARLNEEVTGLRAAYESAEQALEEQDAAIDKLTRDLQATQHKLAQAHGTEQGKPGSGLTPISKVMPRPDVRPPEPAKAAMKMPEPAKATSPGPGFGASSPAPVASSPAHVASSPAPAAPPPAAAPVAAAKPAAPATVVDSEATQAISLADLVGQIDQKASPFVGASVVAAKPAPAAAPAPAPAAAKPAAAPVMLDGEATQAISLADLVNQIDKKGPAAATLMASSSTASVAPAPAPVAAPAAKPVFVESTPSLAVDQESTLAMSLDALVAQIDARPALDLVKTAAPAAPAATKAPAKAEPEAALDVNEATVAVSLADLVGAIDSGPNDVKLKIKAAPAGALDDLKEIRGIGPATEKRLNSAGIVTWTQMAGLSETELSAVADLLKISVDKIKREQWVEQARALGAKA